MCLSQRSKLIMALVILITSINYVSSNNDFKLVKLLENSKLKPTEKSAIIAYIDDKKFSINLIEFGIELPGEKFTTVIQSKFDKYSNNRFSWIGYEKNNPSNQIILNRVDGHYVGAFFTDQATYSLDSIDIENGHIKISELFPEKYPRCSLDRNVNLLLSESSVNVSSIIYNNNQFSVIDVAIMYTTSAMKAAGGKSAIEAIAQGSIDSLNLTFKNSLVNAQARLVKTILSNYKEDEVGDSGEYINYMFNDDSIYEIRENYGADMVALFVEKLDQGSGTAPLIINHDPFYRSLAIQVTRFDRAINTLTFAHEAGHNMGLDHDPANAVTTPENNSFPWSYGHDYPDLFRTVMSYGSTCGGCPVIPNFSNPNIEYKGFATGIEKERDAARTLNLTAPLVADFSPSNYNDVLFVDGFENFK